MGEVREMSGGPVALLCSVMVCVRHEPDLERLQPVQAARAAGPAVPAGGAAPGSEKCGPGAAAAAGGEVEEGGAREAADLLEAETEYSGLW